MIRVLHIDAGNMFGGVETFLVTLARYRGLCPNMEPEFAVCFEGRLASELDQCAIPVHRLGAVRVANPLSVMSARRNLRRVLSQSHFDAVICHMPWVYGVFSPVVRKQGLPLVFWLHSAAEGRHWVERWASLTSPDLAVGPGRFASSTIRNIFPKVRQETIHYAIPAPSPIPMEERIAIRRSLDTDIASVVIVQAGRMAAFKGYKDHLRALAALRDLPSWTCWIVGGPQNSAESGLRSKLENQASEARIGQRVRFVGQRSDVPRLLAAADIYCQPNTAPEGLPIVFGEAMYAGLPIVATALGGFDELVQQSCGLLVPPGDRLALTDALRRLVEDSALRKSMGEAGCDRIAAMTDPALQMKKLCATIMSISQPLPREDFALRSDP